MNPAPRDPNKKSRKFESFGLYLLRAYANLQMMKYALAVGKTKLVMPCFAV